MRDRVEMRGGMIWIESRPGKGMTISPTLPLRVEPKQPSCCS
ncbi:MAG TPA: hypothetical protein VMF55_07735 [Solirubrobacterales bacterium]|nr:hypothetical protein [Solirubrobacterales bacterium]